MREDVKDDVRLQGCVTGYSQRHHGIEKIGRSKMDIERAKFNSADGFKNPQEIASTQELSSEKHFVS